MKSVYAGVNKDKQKRSTYGKCYAILNAKDPMFTVDESAVSKEDKKVHDFRRRSSAIVSIFTRLDSKTGFVRMWSTPASEYSF